MGLTGNIDDFILPPGIRCTVGAVLDSLEDDDAERVRGYIYTQNLDGRYKYHASSVAAFLKSNNIEVAEGTINRHRGRKCKCPH